MIRRTLAVAILTLALATVAQASWYDDYDEGLAAIKSGKWNVAVQKMSAAIKGNPKEGTRVRTYGTIMISYHPYYYRGAAYLNSGRYEEAIADFERTSGQASDLGSLDALMGRAKKALAAANEPEPAPVQARPEPVRPAVTQQPAPVQPAVPQIDPNLRQRAGAALAAAKLKIQQAQQRRATTSPQYAQAMSIFTDATTRNASARNNDDLQSIITMADNAGDLAELAQPPSAAPAIATPAPALPTTTSSPIVPRPTAAARNVMDEYSDELREALEQYFAGEFEDAAARFQDLTTKMPNNGWIHAFLGAAQYSRYAFEADESYRKAAMDAFRKAKQLRSWKDGLPPRYFSKRIRQAFSETL
jgi:tetratricopeptide (TPR) repeat protein